MGTHFFSRFKERYGMAKIAPSLEFVSERMSFVASALWVLLYSFLLYVLPRVLRHRDKRIEDNGSVNEESEKQIGQDCRHDPLLSGQIDKNEAAENENWVADQRKPQKGLEEEKSFCPEGASINAATTSRYQFYGSTSYSCCIEGPQTMNLPVQEMFSVSKNESDHDQSMKKQELSSDVIDGSRDPFSFHSSIDDDEVSFPKLECAGFDVEENGDCIGDLDEDDETECSVCSDCAEEENEKEELISSFEICEEIVDEEKSCSIESVEEKSFKVEDAEKKGCMVDDGEEKSCKVEAVEEKGREMEELEDNNCKTEGLDTICKMEKLEVKSCKMEDADLDQVEKAANEIKEGISKETSDTENHTIDCGQIGYSVDPKKQETVKLSNESVKLSNDFFAFLDNFPEYDSDSETSLSQYEPEGLSEGINDEGENSECSDEDGPTSSHDHESGAGSDDSFIEMELSHRTPIVPEQETVFNDDIHQLNSHEQQHHEFDHPENIVLGTASDLQNCKRSKAPEHQSSVSDMKKHDHDHSSDHEEEEDTNDDEVDALLEHLELVKQMKKQMRQIRGIGGLPTILEESESLPRIDEELMKPLKINNDAKVGHKDRLDEIQTFYRSYLEKMRKLDILSNQTMYAIGVLQMKNPDYFSSNKKQSVALTKMLSNKLRRHESDPLLKLIRDLNKDLELVYIGQLCVSWEILKWEHGKAKELQLYDSTGLSHLYNVAAEDFQQFEVILQRYVEDEPFHEGPRVQNYIKNRTTNSHFLQVPPVRVDPKNGKLIGEKEGAISIYRLVDIIEESIHVMWQFVHADKELESINVSPLRFIPGCHQVDLEDDSDSELYAKIQRTLVKKGRRLKDMIRSGNCIVRKFQKPQECQLTLQMLFAQIELRLVSRVMSMSSLTKDQLHWCHKKISKISVVGRKVHIEPSFLLFPC